jgi:hypothetical protein
MVDINNNYFINPELIWVEFFISHHWMITKLVITHGTGIQIQGALMMYWFDQLFSCHYFVQLHHVVMVVARKECAHCTI